MDELVNLISEKTGLPEKQARQAAEVAVDFIKDKLPERLFTLTTLKNPGR